MSALRGRRAVVTGGSRGIGLAIAKRLAREGARLALIGRDAAALADAARIVAAEVPEGWQLDWPADWRVETRQVDVTDEAALTDALAALGPVDILVANAGGATARPFLDLDAQAWRAAMALNLDAAFVATSCVLAAMRRRGWGRIVYVASTAGLKGYAQVAGYCAAKHGLIGLARALALETAGWGVTVNAVCPGFVETAMLERALAEGATRGREPGEARQRMRRANPQNRFIEPEEVAAAVAYFCRDEARGLTGQALSVSGGEVM